MEKDNNSQKGNKAGTDLLKGGAVKQQITAAFILQDRATLMPTFTRSSCNVRDIRTHSGMEGSAVNSVTFHQDESKKALFTLVISVKFTNFNLAKR